jgi:DHA2 family multidrug resistance protein
LGNVVPGILAVLVAAWLVTAAQPQLRQIRQVDWLSLAGMALALAALEIALKDSLSRGWLSPLVLVFLAVSAASGTGFIRRSLQHASPVVALRSFNDRRFTIACILSFVLCFAFFSRSGWGWACFRRCARITIRCSGRRLCAALRSCFACCRRPAWRWVI